IESVLYRKIIQQGTEAVHSNIHHRDCTAAQKCGSRDQCTSLPTTRHYFRTSVRPRLKREAETELELTWSESVSKLRRFGDEPAPVFRRQIEIAVRVRRKCSSKFADIDAIEEVEYLYKALKMHTLIEIDRTRQTDVGTSKSRRHSRVSAYRHA